MKRIKALITAVILCLVAFVPFTLTAEAEEPVSGFCAVGEVKDSRAAILLADGTVRSVDIEGAAPASGTVCSYTANGEKYSFAAASFGGYTGWALWNNMDGNGAFFFGTDGTNNYYGFFAENAVGFMKFGNTSWRVFTGKDMVGESAKGGIYPSNIDGVWDGTAGKISVIYADATSPREQNDPRKFMDPTGAGFTDGDKNVVLSGGETPPPAPGPQIPADVSLCAVGEVSPEKGLAAILTPDGKVRTVKFTGTAPKSGAVHAFTVKNGICSFTLYSYFAEGTQWRVYDGLADGDSRNNDFFVSYDQTGAETRLYCADDCVTFIRFSDTNWSVFNRGNVINLEKKIGDFDHTVWPCGLMFAWTDSSVVSLQTRITSVFCDASGDKAPTRYYTADQSEMEKGAYDVTISENDVWSPSTADAITAAAVIAVLISGVATVSKKARKA